MVRVQMEIIDDNDHHLLTFLTSCGGKFPKLRYPVTNQDGIRAVFLKEAVPPGEHLLEIPLRALMTPEAARSAIRELGEDEFFLKDDKITLAVFLYFERAVKGTQSFWHPYLASLPSRSFSVTEWSSEELNELQDDELVRKVLDRKASEDAMFHECRKRLPNLITSREEFSWSLFIVESRAFGRRLPHLALVPLADALNHNNVRVKYGIVRAGEEGHEEVFAMWYTGGDGLLGEAFNSYGRLSNEDLILHYGFALSEENEWDMVLANFSVRRTDRDSLASMKRHLTRRCGLGDPFYTAFRHSYQEVGLWGVRRGLEDQEDKTRH